MPVLDWTRTNLKFGMEDGSRALRFDATAFTVFEVFLLKRLGAEQNYTEQQIDRAKAMLEKMSSAEKQSLINNIIARITWC